jgi:exonuclease III
MMLCMKLISLNINIDQFSNLVFPFLKKENPDVFCLQELLEEDFEKFKKEFDYQGVFIPTVYLNHPSQGGRQNRRFGLGIFAKNIVSSDFFYYVGSKEHIDCFGLMF